MMRWVEAVATVLGVSTVDVRDVRQLERVDALDVRLWNRRRLQVDTIDAMRGGGGTPSTPPHTTTDRKSVV